MNMNKCVDQRQKDTFLYDDNISVLFFHKIEAGTEADVKKLRKKRNKD